MQRLQSFHLVQLRWIRFHLSIGVIVISNDRYFDIPVHRQGFKMIPSCSSNLKIINPFKKMSHSVHSVCASTSCAASTMMKNPPWLQFVSLSQCKRPTLFSCSCTDTGLSKTDQKFKRGRTAVVFKRFFKNKIPEPRQNPVPKPHVTMCKKMLSKQHPKPFKSLCGAKY